jgi:hypothetical protein
MLEDAEADILALYAFRRPEPGLAWPGCFASSKTMPPRPNLARLKPPANLQGLSLFNEGQFRAIGA